MLSRGKRVIALVDMDCFYVQVAQRKNPTLKGKPCAVVQYNTWQGGGIIAVGYEARKFGVTRQMRGNQAKEKCPDIVLVPVPENRGKADLTQFREAGAEVIDVLATFVDCLERASIDEAYMDLTNTINKTATNYTLEDVAFQTFTSTHLVGLENMDVQFADNDEILKSDLYRQWKNTLASDEYSFRLAIGAVIADRMRKAVFEQTGFSCSAGVGPNKMLAKVVAGFHKPNQQTLVLQQNVSEMFETTKIRKIRSLGGKVGAMLVEKFKVEYMSELVQFSLQELQANIGMKSGDLVYWLCRGVDHEPVRPRQLPKSVGCSKNFRGLQKLKTKSEVHKWLTNLCEEVIERLQKEEEQNNRVATLFTVGCLNDLNQSQSRRCSVTHITLDTLRDEAFRSLSVFNKSTSSHDWNPPIINLNINASKFQTISTQGSKPINSFLSSAPCLNDDGSSSRDVSTNNNIREFQTINKSISDYFAKSDRNTEASENSRNTVIAKGVSIELSETHHSLGTESSSLHKESDTSTNSLPECPLPLPIDEDVKRHSGCNLFSKFCLTDEETSDTNNSNISPCYFREDDYSNRDVTHKLNQRETPFGLISAARCASADKKPLGMSNSVSNDISPSISDLMNCEKCGKRMLVWDLPDHMDFHFAKDVQDNLKNEFLNLYSKNNPVNKTESRFTRYVHEPARKRSKIENSLAKYFSPVKKSN